MGESEQGNLTFYQERQAKAAAQKVNCEQELAKANTVLKNEIDDRIAKSEDTKKMNGEVAVIKKDIEDLELALQRLEQDKTNRDHTIRGLNDEIAQNDEAINKLNKKRNTLEIIKPNHQMISSLPRRRSTISMVLRASLNLLLMNWRMEQTKKNEPELELKKKEER